MLFNKKSRYSIHVNVTYLILMQKSYKILKKLGLEDGQNWSPKIIIIIKKNNNYKKKKKKKKNRKLKSIHPPICMRI